MNELKMRRCVAGIFAAGLATFAVSTEAKAAGFLGDVFNSVGNSIKLVQPPLPVPTTPPPAVVKEQPESKAQLQSVYTRLLAMKEEDLAIVAELRNPCSDVNCEGLSSETVTRLAKSTYDRRQAHLDAEIKQQQAWAATASAGMALLSLVISIASFVRAGRAAKAAKAT